MWKVVKIESGKPVPVAVTGSFSLMQQFQKGFAASKIRVFGLWVSCVS